MEIGSRNRGRLGVAVAALAMSIAAGAPAAHGAVRFQRLKGFAAPGTPAKYNKVGLLETGRRTAKNVLVLIPGTSASAAYFEPLAKTIVKKAPGWRVWSIERRENLLEDHSMANRAKTGRATPKELFDYYLGYLTDRSVTTHYHSVPDSDVVWARRWGMRVAVEDIRRVVRAARKLGGKVVLGGHSLGGTITTAYATWDFAGRAGAEDLSGLVYIDGGSRSTPVTSQQATTSLAEVEAGSPWLVFGGIPAPFAGLFNIVGAGLAHSAPDEPSLLQTWPLLPSFLNGPFRATNESGYGFALDTETSPAGLAAAQVHAGRVARAGSPRAWVRDGELTPIQRLADMFYGTGLKGLDGTAWYHPRRLTIDAGAVAAGNANPAQAILEVRATHGDDLRGLRIYGFGAALGGRGVLDAVRLLARQSKIPGRRLTLVDRHEGYSHIDPISAAPDNDFVSNLVPFLGKVGR